MKNLYTQYLYMSHSKKPYNLAAKVMKLARSPDANMADVKKTLLNEIDAAFRVEYPPGTVVSKTKAHMLLPILLEASGLPPSQPIMHPMRAARFGAHEPKVLSDSDAEGIVKHSRRRRHAKRGAKRGHHHAKRGTKRGHHHAKRGTKRGHHHAKRGGSNRLTRMFKRSSPITKARKRYQSTMKRHRKQAKKAAKLLKREQKRLANLTQKLATQEKKREEQIKKHATAVESAIQKSRQGTVEFYGGGTTSYGYKHPVDNVALRHSYAAVSPLSTCLAK